MYEQTPREIIIKPKVTGVQIVNQRDRERYRERRIGILC